MIAKKEKQFYVSNKLMYELYVQWYKDIETAAANNQPEPPIPDYIVESIMKIANKLSFRPNFFNYSYRDDMIAEAIASCISSVKKFNIEKSNNPFSYFTTIAYNVFIGFISNEKNQTYVKAKLMIELPVNELFDMDDEDCEMENSIHNGFMEYIREHAYIADTKPPKSRRKPKLAEEESTLNEFIHEDHIDEDVDE
jgi:hypothetical protein